MTETLLTFRYSHMKESTRLIKAYNKLSHGTSKPQTREIYNIKSKSPATVVYLVKATMNETCKQQAILIPITLNS